MAITVRRRSVDERGARLPTSVHPVIARAYAARGVESSSDLDYALKHLHPYTSLTDIGKAADLLAQALKDRNKILVVGDFDADGATSCALAVRGLRLLGAADVSYLVPNRFDFGYGLTPELVEVAAQSSPDLVVTVDNGISSIAGVEAARRHGIRVLVTDHHLPGAELPAAEAIVNPNRHGDAFPSKHIAGVGVMFYVLTALRARLRDLGWFASAKVPEPNLAQLLDLVALGTVADLVPLDHNNRILVAQGLARIRQGQCGAGIKALLRVARRDHRVISASDLGYAVGPRLNAAGRLTDMSLGIECLLAEGDESANAKAKQLDALNSQRRVIEAQMHDRAMEHLRDLQLDGTSELPFGLCLFDDAWHQGVVGILASRVKERVHRPVIAFAPEGPEAPETLKGSARSVDGLHIRDALEAVASRCPGLIRKFGGHAMAAGLTLAREHYRAFSEAFDQEVRRHLSEDDLAGVVYSDGPLNADEINLPLAQALRDAGPWGQGFPEPLFDGEFQLLNRKLIKDKHLKLALRAREGGPPITALAFGKRGADWPDDVQRVRAAYRLHVDTYRGQSSARLTIEHVEPLVSGSSKDSEQTGR